LEVFDDEGLSDTSGPYDITVTDNDPPGISNIDADPDSQIIDGYVNLSADVSDNIDVSVVKVQIEGPSPFVSVNETMLLYGGNTYYYYNNYSIIGVYNYTIWAQDLEGNSILSSINNFEIVGEIIITNLEEDWNFFSLPFNQTVNKEELFFVYLGSEYNWTEANTAGIIIPFIYDFNRTTQIYNDVDTVTGGRGYWIFAYHACEMWATGLEALSLDSYITNMKTGWNALGAPTGETVNKTELIFVYGGTDYNWTEATSAGIIVPFIYSFDRTLQYYIEVEELSAGNSYWIFTYYDCVLKKEA
jgi:hypothetical protein